jgi:tetratricopeptide (TPR) repeat protein
MTKRLPMLTGGPRDAPARQRTLRDTIAWSYEQLDEPQRQLFTRLSVFDGHTYLEAIESVLGGEGMLDCLADLCDASLVSRVDPDHELFGMLETLREFARERLEPDPGFHEVRETHARYFLVFASIASEGLKAAGQREWLERLRVNDGNLRAALDTFLEWGKGPEALRLATALRPFWQRVGALAAGRKRLQQALALAKDAPPQLRAPALLGNGVLAWRQGDLDAAEPLLRDGLELARAAGDNATTINALRSLGALAQNRADYREARALLTSSVELAKQLNDIEAESNTYLSLGNVALDQGQHAEADAHYTRSLELSEQISDTLGYAYALDNLGVSAWHRGDLDRASRLADEVMELYQQLGIESGKANVWHRRCLVALESGRLQDAEDHGMRALRVRTAQGEDRAGAFVLYDLARVALARGDSELARSRLRQGLKLALPHGAPVIDVLYLEGTAAYLEQVGEYGDAYLLLAAAETWRARIGVPVAPVVLKSQSALGASLAARHDAYGRARLEERARDASPAELTALVSRLLEA